jgi:hypothetical protein
MLLFLGLTAAALTVTIVTAILCLPAPRSIILWVPRIFGYAASARGFVGATAGPDLRAHATDPSAAGWAGCPAGCGFSGPAF